MIVGASLAGGLAAATLREEGFDGNIVLIGEELHSPYERPPLSKEYLRGEQPFEKALVRPPEFYKDQKIETHFGNRAVRIDATKRGVELAGGERVDYDKLLIATGSRNRRIPIPGIELEGVYDLRTVADADRIRSEIAPGKKAAIVGMGFIGAEVAASLRSSGLEVAVVEALAAPMIQALGEEVAGVVEAIHRDHGVEMFFREEVSALEGSGRVERVTTKGGRTIPCDFVIVGVGVEPVVDFVEGSGVEVDNGIVVDEYCRTNVEGIFAAGDVTNHYHPLFARRMRVEHWQNAMKQGPVAARNMLGKAEPYDEVHWFWSDQYDFNIQYAGVPTDWDQSVERGSREDRSFAVFYLREGRILLSLGINRGKDIRGSLRLIKAQRQVDPEKLKDEDVEIRSLMK